MRPVLFHSVLMATAFFLGFYLIYEAIPDPSEDYAWDPESSYTVVMQADNTNAIDTIEQTASPESEDAVIALLDNPPLEKTTKETEASDDSAVITPSQFRTLNVYGDVNRLKDRYLFESFRLKHNISVHVKPLPALTDNAALKDADVIIGSSARTLNELSKQSLFSALSSNVTRNNLAVNLKEIGTGHKNSEWIPLTKYAYAVFSSKGKKNTSSPISAYKDMITLDSTQTLLINDEALEEISAALFKDSKDSMVFKQVVLKKRAPESGSASDEALLRQVASANNMIAVTRVDAFMRLQYSGYAKDRGVSERLEVSFPNTRQGTIIGISGAGIGSHAKNPQGAEKLLNYLLSRQGQYAYAYKRMEYPVCKGAVAFAGLHALGSFKENTDALRSATQ